MSYVVVDDQLRFAVEDIDEPDRPLGPDQGVFGHLHHREPASLRGDRVEFPGGGLLAEAQLVQLLAPGLIVDYGWQSHDQPFPSFVLRTLTLLDEGWHGHRLGCGTWLSRAENGEAESDRDGDQERADEIREVVAGVERGGRGLAAGEPVGGAARREGGQHR